MSLDLPLFPFLCFARLPFVAYGILCGGDSSNQVIIGSPRRTPQPLPPPLLRSLLFVGPSTLPSRITMADRRPAISLYYLFIFFSRRFRPPREAAEKKAAADRYAKLHAEGKTDQAKSDMARLAEIRKKRAADAERRKAEQEEAARESAAKQQTRSFPSKK